MNSKILKKGDSGLLVALWQQFLIENQFMSPLIKDDVSGNSFKNKDDYIIGSFEDITEESTKKYQLHKKLKSNGILDSETCDMAAQEGFNGDEVEAALLLGFNRVNRTLLSRVEIIFTSRNVALKIDGRQLSANEALKYFRALDDVG